MPNKPKVRWVPETVVIDGAESRDIIAYHPHCNDDPLGIDSELETVKHEDLEEIFCASCRQLIGYYDLSVAYE